MQDDFGDDFYMRARIYDADSGRFTKRDPIGLQGGDFNLYRFAGNDPVNNTDPSGLLPSGDIYGAVGAEFTVGGGGNIQGGGFIHTGDGFVNGLLDSGLFVSPGSSVGLNIGLSAGFGVTPDLSGFSNNVNGSFKVVGGSVQLDDNGKPVGGFVGFAPSLDDIIPAPTASASFSTSYGVKLTPRKVINGISNTITGVDWAPVDVLTDSQYNQFAQKRLQDPVVRSIFDNSTITDPQERLLDAVRKANRMRAEDPDSVNQNNPPPSRSTESITIGPRDPNQIIGPGGFGAEPITGEIDTQPVRFGGWVKGGEVYPYTILFENKPDATAPAQIVTVTQTLDSDLDMTTFELGSFGWADFEVTAPKGLSSWSTRVDAIAKLGVYVDVSASLNAATRVLTVTYTSIDPVTGDVPLDPFAGFLPPNVTAPQGDGFLTYSIKPLAGVTSGTEITAVASVVFDFEAPLSTPTLTNKIDTIAPTSSVLQFPSATTSRGKFKVVLASFDETGGSGFDFGSVFFSDNGGPLQTLVPTNSDSDFLFTGGIAGHTYTFFGRGQDNAGNISLLPLTPTATIQVVAPTLLPVVKSRTFTDSDGDVYTVKISGPGTLNAVLLDPDSDDRGSLDQLFLTGSTAKTKVTVTVKKNKTGGDGIVAIGDLTVTGDLGAFTAKQSDFIVDGIIASGALGKVSVRDFTALDPFLGAPGITTGGTPASKLKLALAARGLSDGFVLSTPTGIASIAAQQIGEGSISGATLGSLTTKFGDANMNLAIPGAVGTVTIGGSANVSQWSVGSIGAVTIGGTLNADIDATTTVKSVSIKNGALNGQITGTTIGPVSIKGGDLGGFIGASAPVGKTKAFGGLSITGGSLTGSVAVTGAMGDLTVNGGHMNGTITSGAIGKVTITGGDLSGDILVAGAAGAVSVKSSKTGAGGGILGTTLVAAKIASLTVAKDLTDSRILAGAALGADVAIGGGDDTFAAATIGAVKIGGNITSSVIAAGLSNPDGIFDNGDDTLLGIAPKITSKIAALIVKGSADPDSYFATGAFTAAPKIGTSTIAPATDPRFLVA